MFFSIVIPVHNSEKYLEECLESILCQTFWDYEVILVNDGSLDESGKICNDYCEKDSRFIVINKTKAGGAALARNIGTEKARGEYIIYIDSDDYLECDTFLEDIAQKAKEDYDIVCYKFRKYYDGKDRAEECMFSIPQNNGGETIGSYIIKLVEHDAFYCAPWTKAIRRKILADNNIYFQRGLLSEDQEWYYRVLMGAKSIAGINKSYVVYRQHRESTSVSWTMKNLTDTISIISKWKNFIEREDLTEDYRRGLLNSLAKLYCNLLIGYTRFSNPEKKEYFKKLKGLSGLLEFHINPRVKQIYKIYRIAGFNTVMFALKLLCKWR